jgi:hypothetical protein
MKRFAALTLVVVVVAAGCGDGDTDTNSSQPVSTEESAATTTTTEAAAPLPAECTTPPFDVAARLDGDGPTETLTVSDAVAVRISAGRGYTVNLTASPSDRAAGLLGQGDAAPPGSFTITTGLTVFNASDPAAVPILEAGAVGPVEWTAGETATFISVESDLVEGGFSVDQAGSSQVLFVDDTRICIRAELTSETGPELIGVYTAEIVQDF